MLYAQALIIAHRLKAGFEPFCIQTEIAGSVRRGTKTEVKDIEIACRPKLTPEFDLFDSKIGEHPTELLDYLHNVFEKEHHYIKGKERYRQYALTDGINLDLFIIWPPAQWGIEFLRRTGPAEYSQWMVTLRSKNGACPSHLRFEHGAIWSNNHIIETPTEQSVFDLYGLPFVEPAKRQPLWGGAS